jgi:3-dehydroquinate synthase
MKTLRIDLGDISYPVIVGRGLLVSAGEILSEIGFTTRPIVITNSHVLKLHGASLIRSLRKVFGIPAVIRIGDGEQFKTHSTLTKIYDGMFRASADRRSWIIAFGGGVVGDIAGYAAATFMRGIPFAVVPTTLLAQVDSSVGGKVGVNVPQGKNLIGAFHQPAAVLSDSRVLKSLPRRELAAGIYEVIKCAAIRSERLLHYLELNLDKIMGSDPARLEHIVFEASRIKAGVVTLDEKEQDLRMVLNYGHTVGHALEAATGYRRFKHGEAIAWGMIAALAFGREVGLMGLEETQRLERLIHSVEKLPSLKGIPNEQVNEALMRDKKFRSGNIHMVLLKRLGQTEIRADIDPGRFRRFLKRFLEAGGRVL